MVRIGNENGMCFQKSDRVGCREEEKASNTEEAVDGQHQCEYFREYVLSVEEPQERAA